MEIYHNPRCAGSRAGLKYLQEKGYDVKIKKYMTEGLSTDELKTIMEKSGKKPVDFIRKQEKIYRDLYRGKDFSDDEWIEILAANPRLLERPVVINEDKAVVANPPEKLDQIL